MVRGQMPIVRGLVAAELTESQAALRVYAAASGLVVLGVLLLVFTIRWWRDTRPEPASLAPLEVMGDRQWSAARDADRRKLLDEHRPTGADRSTPLIIEPEPIDLSILAREVPETFDDLREDTIPPELPESPAVSEEAQAEEAQAGEAQAGEAQAGEAQAEQAQAEQEENVLDLSDSVVDPDILSPFDETIAVDRDEIDGAAAASPAIDPDPDPDPGPDPERVEQTTAAE